MLEEPIDAPGETSPEELLARYSTALADVVESRGPERVVEETDLDPAAIEAVESGDAAGLDLRDAAAILALREGSPDAAAILAAVHDQLLLAMSSAMLDVDRIAADVGGDMDAKEVHAKVEGRQPMTLAEYARLHHYVADSV